LRRLRIPAADRPGQTEDPRGEPAPPAWDGRPGRTGKLRPEPVLTGIPPAGVLDAVGLDQPAVDRGLLVGLAGAGQLREEKRPIAGGPGVEPGVELVEDVLPGVQALGLLPGPEARIPRLAGLAPFRLPV